ncbi:MAG: hypothetical protein QW594_00700 [Candidatus Woesearchaeota archaeon]
MAAHTIRNTLFNALFFVLIGSVLLLASTGCSSSTIREVNPYQGTKGLVMSFMKQMPPDQIYENERFPIGISIENKGAHDVGTGSAVLTIISENDIVKVEDSLPYDDFDVSELFGKNLYSDKGGKKLVHLTARSGIIKDFTVIKDINLIAQLCYEYVTYYSSPICIDAYSHDDSFAKPCVSKVLTSSGTGAPVAVSKIETRFSKKTNLYGADIFVPSFLVFIKKVSDEDIIDAARIYDICTGQPVGKDDFGKIYIEEAWLGVVEMECTPNPLKISPISSEEFQGTSMRCVPKQEYDNDIPYDTYIKFKLKYGVSQKIAKKIRVENVD